MSGIDWELMSPVSGLFAFILFHIFLHVKINKNFFADIFDLFSYDRTVNEVIIYMFVGV